MTQLSSSRAHIAIVGGGITGLACALALAERGARVTVYESGPRAGEGALIKSGGMLAQGFESANEKLGPAFNRLADIALSQWPNWAQRIETLSGQPFGFRQAGSLSPALNDRDMAWVDDLASGGSATTSRRLSVQEARRIEPELSPACVGAIHFPLDGEVDNRRLSPALVGAAQKAGVKVQIGFRIESLETLDADAIILATGFATETLMAEITELAHIAPVRGQMLAFDGAGIMLTGSIRGARIYLSQKGDGRIVAGATSEFGRTDDVLDAGTSTRLYEAAIEMLPRLASASVIEEWVGFRPASPDGLPILGASSQANIVLAQGVYRNGVLFAPAVGDAIARHILDGDEIDPAFDPRRFDKPLTPS